MLGAASSSMICGFHGLPQNPSNQRPTTALLSCSRDITDPPMLWLKLRLSIDEGVSTSRVGGGDIRFLRFDSPSTQPRTVAVALAEASLRIESGTSRITMPV